MTRRAVVFNGPPASGKDAGAAHVVATFGAHHREMKQRLIEIARAIYGVTPAEWEAMYVRELREVPQAHLDGLSPREALIHVAEDVIKPAFGKGVFGRATARKLGPGLNSISDGGFIEEIEEVVKVVGAENVLVLRVHSADADWRIDSRRYLDGNALAQMGVGYYDLRNAGNERFFTEIDRALADSGFLEGQRSVEGGCDADDRAGAQDHAL